MPRLLINPQFVEAHAATPERLLMLVMHELHHVLLGHTRLPTALVSRSEEARSAGRTFSRRTVLEQFWPGDLRNRW
jgi:hypothetical protein